MADVFLQTLSTPAVLAAQRHYYGRSSTLEAASGTDGLTPEEQAFIETRDSFYMATVTENGWPYVQHRGGAPGFLRVLNPNQLGFADFRGNRQMLSTGNLAANDRVSLILMDYPRRERLKILGHARVVDAREHPELVARFGGTDRRVVVERVVLIDVVSYDWNCPQHITPRYTAAEVDALVAPLRQRISELEQSLSGVVKPIRA
jgi:hypothetical protein